MTRHQECAQTSAFYRADGPSPPAVETTSGEVTLSLETYWKRSVRHGRLVAVRTMSRRSRGGVHPTLGDAVDGRLSWLCGEPVAW